MAKFLVFLFLLKYYLVFILFPSLLFYCISFLLFLFFLISFSLLFLCFSSLHFFFAFTKFYLSMCSPSIHPNPIFNLLFSQSSSSCIQSFLFILFPTSPLFSGSFPPFSPFLLTFFFPFAINLLFSFFSPCLFYHLPFTPLLNPSLLLYSAPPPWTQYNILII